MKKTVFTLLAFIFTASALYAQSSMDQKVEVTNAYRSSMSALVKNETPVNIPDSVLHFDYKFDYSFFETPYKGSYDFRPYSVNLVPEPSARRSGKLCISLDGGYNFYPQLHAVWTPVDTAGKTVSIFNDFSGYYGKYRSLDRVLLGNGYRTPWGFDLSETFGADAKFIMKKADLQLLAAYDGIFTDESPSGYNSGRLDASLKGHDDLRFPYTVNLHYRYAWERPGAVANPAALAVHGNEIKVDGTVSAMFSRKYYVWLDYLADMDFLANAYGNQQMTFALTPYTRIYLGNFDIKLGIRLSYAYGDRFRVFPSCEASVKVLNNSMLIYAGADGGHHNNSFYDLKTMDHHYNPGWTMPETTAETVNGYGGFKGHIGRNFSYDIRGGYGHYVHMPFADAMTWYVSGAPSLVYTTTGIGYASARLYWDSRHVSVSGNLDFRKTVGKVSFEALDIPMFTGNLKAVYNYRKRIYAGVTLSGASSRSTTLTGFYEPIDVKVPGWVDLGVSLEYRLNSCWSVRFQAGNLAGCDIRRYSPFYSEKGRSFSLGLTMIL